MRQILNGDNLFKIGTAVIASSALVILIVTSYTLSTGSWPVLQRFGFNFFTGTMWNPVEGREVFGVLPYILGTLATSGIALLIGVPLSFGIAIFLVEMAPKALRVPISYLVELLAAVPSVIYGLWGLFIFRYWIQQYVEKPISIYLGWIPVFSGTPFGLDVFTAGIILAIMIIPTVASISKEVISAVPDSIREGAYSIGATKWEVVKNVIIPYSKLGVFGGIVLSLGRAIGETMAVAFVLGNNHRITTSLLEAAATITVTLANEFAEADNDIYLASLFYLALVLFVMSFITLAIAKFFLLKAERKYSR